MTGFWKLRNVFITGCSGFLGSWLVEHLLKEGANIIGLVRDFIPQSSFFRLKLNEKVTVIEGALGDYFLLERTLNEYAIDTVFHLAAQTIVGAGHRNPLSTLETNVRGTWHLLEACRRNHSLVRRIVVSSSDKAYGTQEKLPYTEMSPLKGAHPYDVSKTCADLIAYTYFNTYNLPVAITRCGNIYGGGDLNFSRLVPGTIKSVLHDEPVIIRSDGTLKRDYFYVRDVVNAYTTLAENLENMNLAGEAFNFSTGSPIGVLEMTHKILEAMDKKDFPVQILNETKGEIKDQYLSIEKSKKVLNWTPHYFLEDGLRETVGWYKEFFGVQ